MGKFKKWVHPLYVFTNPSAFASRRTRHVRLNRHLITAIKTIQSYLGFPSSTPDRGFRDVFFHLTKQSICLSYYPDGVPLISAPET